MAQTVSSSEPNRLAGYSQHMAQVDEFLVAQAQRMRRSLLDYEVVCRDPEFSVRVSHLADAVSQHGHTCRPIDTWVGIVAVGFIRADEGWDGTRSAEAYAVPPSGDGFVRSDNWPLLALSGAGIVASGVETGFFDSQLFGLLRRGGLNDLYEFGQTARDISRVGGLAPTPGYGYVGQVNLYGGADLKSLYGWSRHLTHMRFDMSYADNIVKLSGQSGLHAAHESILPSTKLGAAFLAIQVTFVTAENWNEYQEEGLTKVAAGTVVDSAITVGLTAAGVGVGAMAGGALLGAALGVVSGGTLAPVGVAVGSKVGGFVGSWAGDWLAEEMLSTQADEWLTDKLDAGVDEGVDAALEQAEAAARATVELVDNVAHVARDAIASSRNQIETAFESAMNNIVALF